jgi:mannose-6-phosphate isomerase-like protein (cupin superfamily)
VVTGVAQVTVGKHVGPLKVNESIFIPKEELHRIENLSEQTVIIIEVQCGDYLGEDDIVRFEDVYGRVNEKVSPSA